MDTALSDTCMFFIGMCIGIVFNYTFERVIWYSAKNKKQYFSIGIVQIMANALIIRYIRQHVKHTGLFTLGLLSSQTLVIKKCYPKNEL